jgi:hypothetical protein
VDEEEGGAYSVDEIKALIKNGKVSVSSSLFLSMLYYLSALLLDFKVYRC